MRAEGMARTAGGKHGNPRGTPGSIPWLLQRVSGLFLAYALAVHLWAVHVVSGGELTWAEITARLQDGALWTVYYLLFIPAVIYHAGNGIWGIVMDYSPRPTVRRILLPALWVGGLALLAYGYVALRALL